MQSSSHAERRRFLLSAFVLAFVVFFAQATAFLSESLQVQDHEELYNATEGMELLHGHFAQIFLLQYRHFCGGCSVVSALTAGLYAFLPPVLFVFKLLPMFFYVFGFFLAFRLLWWNAGPSAAYWMSLFWIFPPPAYARIAQVAFGNHYESNLYALIALTLALPILHRHQEGHSASPFRYFALGSALGFAVYTCFSAAYLLPAFGLSLLLKRRALSWRLLFFPIGMALGASPWAFYAHATGVNPLTSPIYRDNDWEIGIANIPNKLKTLLAPNQLEGILAQPNLEYGRALGLLSTLAILLSLGFILWSFLKNSGRSSDTEFHQREIFVKQRDSWLLERSLLLMAFSFLGAYLSLRFFQIDYVSDGSAPPSALGLRYLAPFYLHLLLLAPLGAVKMMSRPGWGKRMGISVMLLLLFNGFSGRMATLAEAPWSTAALSRVGTDYPYFRVQAAAQLPPELHQQCTSFNPPSEAFHVWSQAWLEASSAWEGDPGVVLKPKDAEAARKWRLSTLSPPAGPHKKAWYAGVARVYHDHLVKADMSIRQVLRELAFWGGGMSEADFQGVARELMKIEPWLETLVNRNPRLGRFLEEEILPLSDDGQKHDLLRIGIFGVGFVLGNQHLIGAANPPRDLLGMITLVARRIFGKDWETSNLETRPLLHIPQELPNNLLQPWLEGYGEALGARWGPRLRPIPVPEGTPPSLYGLFRDAYREGEGKWFITDEKEYSN